MTVSDYFNTGSHTPPLFTWSRGWFTLQQMGGVYMQPPLVAGPQATSDAYLYVMTGPQNTIQAGYYFEDDVPQQFISNGVTYLNGTK